MNNENPFDDLPDEIKEIFEGLLRQFGNIDPQFIKKIEQQFNNQDFLGKMADLFKNMNLGDYYDEDTAKMIQNMTRSLFTSQHQYQQNPSNEKKIEEPYHEFSPLNENEGNLLIELPGITDLRHINWNINNTIFHIIAKNEETHFEKKIKISEQFRTLDALAKLTNSILILPYKK